MAKYRNVTDHTLVVDIGHGRFASVDPGEIVTIPDNPDRYVQTGETGEPALFEAVATTTTKSATAAKE